MSIAEENRRELNDALTALLEDEAETLSFLTEDAPVKVTHEGDVPVRDEKCPIDGSTLEVVKSSLGREDGSVCPEVQVRTQTLPESEPLRKESEPIVLDLCKEARPRPLQLLSMGGLTPLFSQARGRTFG